MLPANEGFRTDDLARLELDDRLVVDDELLPLDGPPQLRLHPQARHNSVVHGRLEDLETGLALGLGGVHRDVGVAQQFARSIAVPANGDADAGADIDLLAEHPKRRTKGAPNPLGDSGRGSYVRILEENRELVTAESCRRVLRSQG